MENFGAFSVGDSLIPYGIIKAYYNTTFTHGLPIIINLLDNSIFRLVKYEIKLSDVGGVQLVFGDGENPAFV